MESKQLLDRLTRTLFLFVLLTAAAAAVSAQAFTGAKVATLHSDAFSDERAGVARLRAAVRRVEAQFKPQRDELDRMSTQLTRLSDEIKSIQQTAVPATLRTKIEQAETLDRDIKRKRDDAQIAYQKAYTAALEPVLQQLTTALEAYAKARQIDVIIDVSKGPNVYIYNRAVDITTAFIADFNAKNPAAPGT